MVDYRATLLAYPEPSTCYLLGPFYAKDEELTLKNEGGIKFNAHLDVAMELRHDRIPGWTFLSTIARSYLLEQPLAWVVSGVDAETKPFMGVVTDYTLIEYEEWAKLNDFGLASRRCYRYNNDRGGWFPSCVVSPKPPQDEAFFGKKLERANRHGRYVFKFSVGIKEYYYTRTPRKYISDGIKEFFEEYYKTDWPAQSPQ